LVTTVPVQSLELDTVTPSAQLTLNSLTELPTLELKVHAVPSSTFGKLTPFHPLTLLTLVPTLVLLLVPPTPLVVGDRPTVTLETVTWMDATGTHTEWETKPSTVQE